MPLIKLTSTFKDLLLIKWK